MGKNNSKKQHKKLHKKQRKINAKVLFNKEKEPNKLSTNPKSSDSALLNWLKPFLQLVAIIISLIAAYFAYKTYSNNQPSQIQLSIDFPRQKNFISDLKIQDFYIFKTTKHDTLYFDYNGDDRMKRMIVPMICNSSNKAINNFLFYFIFFSFTSDFNENEINSEYDIVQKDTLYYEFDDSIGKAERIVLKYNKNIVYAQSEVPFPLKSLFLSKDSQFSDKTECLKAYFYYNFSYDGMDSSVGLYFIKLYAYLNKDFSEEILENMFDYHKMPGTFYYDYQMIMFQNDNSTYMIGGYPKDKKENVRNIYDLKKNKIIHFFKESNKYSLLYDYNLETDED